VSLDGGLSYLPANNSRFTYLLAPRVHSMVPSKVSLQMPFVHGLLQPSMVTLYVCMCVKTDSTHTHKYTHTHTHTHTHTSICQNI
jgi:hypothetical protein